MVVGPHVIRSHVKRVNLINLSRKEIVDCDK